MATSDIAGLFATPDQYEQARQAAMQDRALAMSRLSPSELGQYGISLGAQQLGRAIGGALGGEDPQLKLIAQRQALLGQLDQTNPESFLQVAQLAARSGDPQFAMALTDYGQQMATSLASQRKTIAEAQKAELSLSQETKLRDELSKLPPDATDADIRAIVTKYGSVDKVLTALQQSSDRAAQREQTATLEREKIQARADIEKEKIQAQKDRDLEKAQNQKERDEAQRKFEERMKQADKDSKESLARLAASLKTPPATSVTAIVDPTNPNQMISIDARVYRGGGMGSPGVIGVSGKEPAVAVREQKITQGKNEIETVIDEMKASFDKLNQMNAIVSEKRSPLSNVISSLQSSSIGQGTGKVFGTKAQEERNVINSLKQRLISGIKNATGMSSQQLNSNFELQSALNSLSDVNLGYEASMRILENLENLYVKGATKQPKQPTSPQSPSPVPSGQTSKGTKYQVLSE